MRTLCSRWLPVWCSEGQQRWALASMALVLGLLATHFPCKLRQLRLLECLFKSFLKKISIKSLILNYFSFKLPALSTASLITAAPSLVAGTDANEPRNEPIGVLTALTMKTSLLVDVEAWRRPVFLASFILLFEGIMYILFVYIGFL